MIISLDLSVGPSYNQLLRQCQLAIETLDGLFCFLLSFKVNKTVPSGLALQSTRLMEEEVKLLHLAKLLEELEEVVFCDFGIQVANP